VPGCMEEKEPREREKRRGAHSRTDGEVNGLEDSQIVVERRKMSVVTVARAGRRRPCSCRIKQANA
jgi:hypothetical protein